MRRALRRGHVAVLNALLIGSSGLAAQDPEHAGTPDPSFIAKARAAASELADPTRASRLGYRLLGPDFPGMGEHWVYPAGIVRGLVDPSRPPVISYTRIDGRRTLMGVAYTLPLGPGEEPPEEPFGKHAWHDHSNSVDEETVLLNSAASMHHGDEAGYRLSMVHVWTHAPNPDGILEQNNWALPFLREGLAVPEHPSVTAARGLSLAHGGRAFYRELIRRTVELTDSELTLIEHALDRHASRAESLARETIEADSERRADQEKLERIWRDLWGEVEALLDDSRWNEFERFVD